MTPTTITEPDDGLFADCREGNHSECLFEWPDASGSVDANQSPVIIQCRCRCHSTTATTATPWQWANSSPVWLKPRRTVCFLVRHVGDNHDDWTTGEVEYRKNKRGHVITYSTRKQAMRIADKLNRRTEQ